MSRIYGIIADCKAEYISSSTATLRFDTSLRSQRQVNKVLSNHEHDRIVTSCAAVQAHVTFMMITEAMNHLETNPPICELTQTNSYECTGHSDQNYVTIAATCA